MADQYIYAVARVRALETTLFSQETIAQLAGQHTYEDGIRFLKEKGWGSEHDADDADAMLDAELQKAWRLVRELLPGSDVCDALLIPDSYHNLKAAIKTVVTGEVEAAVFYENAAVSGKDLIRYIKQKEFSALPEDMRAPAEEAYECLVHTGDGQMCDVIIDRAALTQMCKTAEQGKSELLKEYAETMAAVSDIKIAVRSVRTKKGKEFMTRAMTPCRTIQTDRLIRAAVSGMPDVLKYLEETPYAGGADALSSGSSAFECWCDNRMIDTIRPQKYHSFTCDPVIAYLIARQNEIKTVRMILTGKRNYLSEDAIKERIRKMYV